MLCKSSYTSSIFNFVVFSNKVFVREVALAQSHGGFPPVCQLRCGIARSHSQLLEDVREQFLQIPPAFRNVRSTHGTIERGLCIVAAETRNEPCCVSDNPFQSEHCQRSVCSVCALALPPTLRGLVPAIVSDCFQLFRCFDVIVLENFG